MEKGKPHSVISLFPLFHFPFLHPQRKGRNPPPGPIPDLDNALLRAHHGVGQIRSPERGRPARNCTANHPERGRPARNCTANHPERGRPARSPLEKREVVDQLLCRRPNGGQELEIRGVADQLLFPARIGIPC
jgi:hypothetical protein